MSPVTMTSLPAGRQRDDVTTRLPAARWRHFPPASSSMTSYPQDCRSMTSLPAGLQPPRHNTAAQTVVVGRGHFGQRTAPGRSCCVIGRGQRCAVAIVRCRRRGTITRRRGGTDRSAIGWGWRRVAGRCRRRIAGCWRYIAGRRHRTVALFGCTVAGAGRAVARRVKRRRSAITWIGVAVTATAAVRGRWGAVWGRSGCAITRGRRSIAGCRRVLGGGFGAGAHLFAHLFWDLLDDLAGYLVAHLFGHLDTGLLGDLLGNVHGVLVRRRQLSNFRKMRQKLKL